jgi:hypothetical protein
VDTGPANCNYPYLAVIYTKRTNFARMAKTPAEVLNEILQERGIGPTAFSKMVDEKYQTVNRWRRGEGFNKNLRNQKRAALALKLPPDHFTQPEQVERAESDRREVFDKFCATELGASMTAEEHAISNSVQFLGDIRPTVAYYQLHLALLRNDITAVQASKALKINEAADREIAQERASADVREKRSKPDPRAPKK